MSFRQASDQGCVQGLNSSESLHVLANTEVVAEALPGGAAPGSGPSGFRVLGWNLGGSDLSALPKAVKDGSGQPLARTTCCSSKKFHEEKRVGRTPRRRVAGWSSTGTKGSGEGQVFAMILSVGACFANWLS